METGGTTASPLQTNDMNSNAPAPNGPTPIHQMLIDHDWRREETFFGFHPILFLDQVINTVNDYTSDAVDSLDESLRKNLKSANGKLPKETQESLAKGTDELLRFLQASSDKVFDIWETWATRNIFLLPQDIETTQKEEITEDTSVSSTLAESDALDEEIMLIKKRIQSTHYTIDALQKYKERYTKEIERLEPQAKLAEQLSSHIGTGGLGQVESLLRRLTEQRETIAEIAQELEADEDLLLDMDNAAQPRQDLEQIFRQHKAESNVEGL